MRRGFSTIPAGTAGIVLGSQIGKAACTDLRGGVQQWTPPRLDAEKPAGLAAIVLAGPDPEADGISAFTREDLVRVCEARFGKTFHPSSMSRVLRRLGFSRQKARPSHPKQDQAGMEAFKKSRGVSKRNSVYA